MWLIAMFDVPVATREQRRRYARLRQGLLRQGFLRMQYSVYAKFLPSEEAAKSCRSRVRDLVPAGGDLRLLAITDIQYARMQVFEGKKRLRPESAPDQLLIL